MNHAFLIFQKYLQTLTKYAEVLDEADQQGSASPEAENVVDFITDIKNAATEAQYEQMGFIWYFKFYIKICVIRIKHNIKILGNLLLECTMILDRATIITKNMVCTIMVTLENT